MSIYKTQNHYVHSVAYYALYLDHFEMTTHYHDRCEIMYLLDGCCQVEVDGKLLELQPKQFVFIDHQVPHRLYIEKGVPCSLLNYEFRCSTRTSGSDLASLYEKSDDFKRFLSGGARSLHLYDRGKLGYALKDLIDELEKNNQDDYLLELLLCRMLLELSKCGKDESAITGISYLKKARSYITEHFCEDLSVAEIADHVGINHSYLQTLFAKHFGCGLMTYVNNQRMDRATFLLKNSDLSVTDIAFTVGFNSRQHFGYTFEKRFSMSPKQYRKLNGQNIVANTGDSQQMLDDERRHTLSHTLK